LPYRYAVLPRDNRGRFNVVDIVEGAGGSLRARNSRLRRLVGDYALVLPVLDTGALVHEDGVYRFAKHRYRLRFEPTRWLLSRLASLHPERLHCQTHPVAIDERVERRWAERTGGRAYILLDDWVLTRLANVRGPAEYKCVYHAGAVAILVSPAAAARLDGGRRAPRA